MGNDHIELTAYEAHTDSTVELPLASSGVHAGFPSPAEDFVEGSLDLNRLLIKDSAATFFVRVEGDSMQDAGIYDGNLLVVDKSLHPWMGSSPSNGSESRQVKLRFCRPTNATNRLR